MGLPNPRSAQSQWFVRHNLLAALSVFSVSCTQNLTAIETQGTGGSNGAGGSSSACSTQACDGPGQCCPSLECNKYGRCVAGTGGATSGNDAGYYAGPGQVCWENVVDCGPPSIYPFYYCQAYENAHYCVSSTSSSPNGFSCQLSTDCGSLRCENGRCAPGPLCGVLGTPCKQNVDCCSNQCDTDGTCTTDDRYCRVVGDACSFGNDCCPGNSCSKVGNIYRCLPTTYCRWTHDVCTGDMCCDGVNACVDNRCVEL